MINSKPSDRGVLDHDVLVDKYGRVYVAVGNAHPPNGIIAYLKYVPSLKPTIWRRRKTWLRRVLRRYGVRNVSKVTKNFSRDIYDFVLGASVPFIKWSEVEEWLKPEERLQELVRKASKPLEIKAVEAALRLSDSAEIGIGSLGVTGSLLLGAQNPTYSDINLVIYGCKEALDIAYCRELKLDPMPKEKYFERIHNQSITYGLPENILKQVNPPHKFKAIGDIPVGFTFVSRRRVRYGSIVYRYLGGVRAELYVEGGECSSLQYPSITSVGEVYSVEGPRIEYAVHAVISYEGLFNWVLFRGGCLKVKGVALARYPYNDSVVLVGGKEEPGYVIPC